MRTTKLTSKRLAAKLFLFLHCAFLLFVVLGAPLGTINRYWLYAHVSAVLWTFSINVADWTCPLTTWEERFRYGADQPGTRGFSRYYLMPLLPTNGRPRRLKIVIGISVLIWNVLFYIVLFGRTISFD